MTLIGKSDGPQRSKARKSSALCRVPTERFPASQAQPATTQQFPRFRELTRGTVSHSSPRIVTTVNRILRPASPCIMAASPRSSSPEQKVLQHQLGEQLMLQVRPKRLIRKFTPKFLESSSFYYSSPPGGNSQSPENGVMAFAIELACGSSIATAAQPADIAEPTGYLNLTLNSSEQALMY